MRAWNAIAAAWVAALAVDFFLHAGLFASLYLAESHFLLPAMDAFVRIPAGYMSFLMLTAALWWLMRQLNRRGALPGFATGLMAGLVLWGAFLLGLWSFSTAPPLLLVAWWLGQSIELGISGAVLGAAAAGLSGRRIWTRVLILFAVLAGTTVALQSAGWAPPMARAD